MPDFLLPDLGEGLEEAEIVAWTVQVGDRVEIDQIVVEVETAKAAVEVPIPFAGVVTALHAAPGTPVAVGTPLISVEAVVGIEPRGLREPGAVTADPVAENADPVAENQGAEEGSGNVLIGYGTSTPTRRTRRGARRRGVPVAAVVTAEPAVAPHRTGPVPVISPLVRKLARDGGLDLTRTVGTGPSGLVTRLDVDRALSAATPAPPPAETTGETRIPIRGPRKTMADKLSRSRREIPEATVWVDVDATDLLAARAVLNDRAPHQPVSLLALVARFTIVALRRYPELNAHIEQDEIVIPEHVHLGFAAQTDRGLVVPVIRDAHRLTTRDLSAALAARTAAARDGGLAPADLTGSTITVNNYGVFGVDGSAAIINHPEVAIIGVGRIIDRPWVVDGQLAVRKVSQLTLAFDHRVCDGGTAGGFLRYLADCVESPVVALGEL
jgi:2-oxoisovalerate dehydrogenase E2 component (dihydrolipoyl transacylase)